MGAAHAHGAGHHTHGENRKRLAVVALAMTVAAIVEVVVGKRANSLALLSDAAHAATDVLAILFSLYAVHIAATKPADAKRTFGYGRAELLAALANAAVLWVVAGFLLFRSYERFTAPADVDTTLVGAAALVVLVAEVFAFFYLWSSARENVNVRSAFIHLTGDAASTLAVLASSVAIRFTGVRALDPIVAALIAVAIAGWAFQLSRETAHILLQGVPKGLDLDDVRRAMLDVDGVCGVHDLHVWSITQGEPTLSAHVVVEPDAPHEEMPFRVGAMLEERYHIHHTTLQVERRGTECGEHAHP